ncbi:hypothetical protein LOTGIDRAFT_176151 [Lottia gigantea]|uniref:GON domain-containing protein n=1 Tax=Lottia gigantea TaxID=225164 RepID=V3Z1L9_LOTGI|nr:hypothetical protein LOTGIDRAFT_176151 [Lottia gigantea]ESO84428.1 hypothetical protein LOTGIDRAFT_176151 [Lottia gigantea]
MVEYVCEPGYFPSINPVCTEDGTWSEFVCSPYFKCSEIRKCNDSMEEKDYWLYAADYQTRVKLFCIWGVGAFVSLQHSNMGSFLEYTITGTDCATSPLDNPETKGAGTTEFQKIKLQIPQGYKIIVYIHFVTNSSLKPTYYGSAKDCYPKDNGCGVLGKFVIDTRGTGFKFPDSLTWKTVGISAVIGNITRSMGGHVITGFCGGDCGGYEVDETGNGTHLQIDINDMPPFKTAELSISGLIVKQFV